MMRTRILLTAVFVLGFMGAAQADICSKVERKADGDVEIETVKDAQGVGGVRACIYMDSATSEVFATLTDYPSFPKWMDKVEKVKTTWVDEKTALVDYELGTLFGTYKYQMRRSHEKNVRIWWERSAGDFKTIRGEYRFIPLPGDKGCLFLIETYLDPGKPAPGFILSYFQEKGTKRLLEDIREETRRRRK